MRGDDLCRECRRHGDRRGRGLWLLWLHFPGVRHCLRERFGRRKEQSLGRRGILETGHVTPWSTSWKDGLPKVDFKFRAFYLGKENDWRRKSLSM